MLAYRTTWIVKQGKMQEALDLLSAESKRAKPKGAQVRVYTPSISPNALIFEDAWESAEAHDDFWAEYNQTPEAAPFWTKWHEVTERSVGTERWNVTELG
jgi:hypothetical protein